MASQPDSFSWQQVDQAMANLMLLEVSLEIRELIRKDEQQIHFLNIGNENSVRSPSQRLEMQLLRSDEWAARTYEVYLEVWLCQQKPPSPHFLRGICQHGIQTLTSARTGSVISELDREQLRTSKYQSEWLKTIKASFSNKMKLLLGKWQRFAEIDAKTVEEALAANGLLGIPTAVPVVQARAQMRLLKAKIASIEKRVAMANSALSTTRAGRPNAFRSSLIEQSLAGLKDDSAIFQQACADWEVRFTSALAEAANFNQSHREAQSTQNAKVAMPDSGASSKVKYASGLKRAIAMLFSLTPDASDLQICRHLDADGVELPKTWKNGNNRLFERAYKDPQYRQKVEKTISKVRTQLRKDGLLG